MRNIKTTNHVRKLQISLAGLPVGEIGFDQKKEIVFRYFSEWIRDGFNLSPSLNLDANFDRAKLQLFQGLHGVFSDSLPDGWGLLLMDRQFKKEANWNPYEITPLDRLAYIGSRGMGALEYAPIYEQERIDNQIDLGALANSANKILEGKDDDVLRQLIIQGGSPGGARPKVTVARSNLSNICLSGFDELPDDYSHWIVKFRSNSDPKDMGCIELTYANMAEQSGIEMPYAELITVTHGKNVDDFFAVKRFDRFWKNGKLHVHTLAGMMYADFRTPCMDYDGVLRATRYITNDQSQVEKAFRLMVFNVLIHNEDDHVKNFSFLHDDPHGWKLSPAFDLTYSHGLGNQHTTAISGSGNPNLESVLKIAKDHSINNANRIIGEVRYGVSQWSALAKQNGVTKKNVQEINNAISSIDSKFNSVSYCQPQLSVGKIQSTKV